MSQACEALRLIGEDGLAVREGGTVLPPTGARDPTFVQVDRQSGRVEATDGSNGTGGEGIEEKEHLDLQSAAEQQKEVGRLYRTAMLKTGVWDGVPIEYARAQTETPARNGWDHGWTRA